MSNSGWRNHKSNERRKSTNTYFDEKEDEFRPSLRGADDLPPLFNVGVLVGGVAGGLIIVISVILFCKYCIKRKKGGNKQQCFVASREDDSAEGHDLEAGMSIAVNTHKRFFQKKTLARCQNSTDTQVTELQASVEEDNEIDYAIAAYKESLRAEESVEIPDHLMINNDWENNPSGGDVVGRANVQDPQHQEQPHQEVHKRRSSENKHPPSEEGRRVSFVLAERSTLQNTKTRSPPRLVRYSSDHHPRSKESFTPKVPKQLSLGSAELDHTLYGECRETSMLHSVDDSINELTPMLSPVSEELPVCKPRQHRTETIAEVHQDSKHFRSEQHYHHHHQNRKGHVPQRQSPPKLSALGRARRRLEADTRQTASLELVSPRDRWAAVAHRKVRSYEGDCYSNRDYDDSHNFKRGHAYNPDYDFTEGYTTELRSKVRYNDTGSFEEVGDEVQMPAELCGRDRHSPLSPSPPIPAQQVLIMQAAENSSDTDTLNGTGRYKDLWTLRATLEEEEDFSDTVRMEDMTSPEEHSNEEHIATSVTTSFESNTELSIDASSDETVIRRVPGNLLHPNYEIRGQKYRGILSHRFRHIDGPILGHSTSQDNSFDSVETMETDGDVSDTSRPEVTTTSFESTTDNTDSTGEGTTHKLQQMQRDSGYKSLEAQQSQTNASKDRAKKQIHFVLDHDSIDCDDDEHISTSPDAHEDKMHRKQGLKNSKPYFERRSAKTASKKRREYRGDRHVPPADPMPPQKHSIQHQYSFQDSSIHEHETDSRSDQPSGDSFDDGMTPKKFSLFNRFVRSQSKETKRLNSLTRDFSMDEKTNVLFNEFIRYDPKLDPAPSVRRSPRLHSRPRLQRKHTDSSLDLPCERGRFERLTPGKRSTSLGSDSSGGSLRRLSPQDSIEEEFIPEPVHHRKLPSPISEAVHSRRGSRPTRDVFSPRGPDEPRVRPPHIPIIRLPDEELTSK